MKLVDKCTLRNKRVEKMLRELDNHMDSVVNSNKLDKEAFIKIFLLTLELFIDAFKTIENNTTPGKTLLDFTRGEVNDACFRVGEAKNFSSDTHYILAVMKELGK